MSQALIFKQIAEIESGKKTQTRRVVKEGEAYTTKDIHGFISHLKYPKATDFGIWEVVTPSVRTKWKRGETSAMLPGRGKKGVGFVRITSIRLERLNDISEQDALAEGITEIGMQLYQYSKLSDTRFTAKDCYKMLWENINGVGSWEKNPLVWVIGFEYIGHEKG